tara:strand:+ start:962 stop:1063 length:102 start_codon:yes stop_codon:yes gene_type:complete
LGSYSDTWSDSAVEAWYGWDKDEEEDEEEEEED